MASEFDKDAPVTTQTKKIAFTFGISREAYDRVYTPANKINTDPGLPGPGEYVVKNKTFGREGRRSTIKSRVPIPEDILRLITK